MAPVAKLYSIIIAVSVWKIGFSSLFLKYQSQFKNSLKGSKKYWQVNLSTGLLPVLFNKCGLCF